MSKLPKWFTGKLYEEGSKVTNRFSGEEHQLTAEELSMYDFIMGATMIMEMGVSCKNDKMVDDPRLISQNVRFGNINPREKRDNFN